MGGKYTRMLLGLGAALCMLGGYFLGLLIFLLRHLTNE